MAGKGEQLQIRVSREQKARLRRLAVRAGVGVSEYVLSCALPPEDARFDDLVDMLAAGADARYALAEMNALLATLPASRFATLGDGGMIRQLEPLHQNYVAAMVEYAAARKRGKPPDWVRSVEPLRHPWFASELRSLRPHLLRSAPVPFKRRNLFVDATVGDQV